MDRERERLLERISPEARKVYEEIERKRKERPGEPLMTEEEWAAAGLPVVPLEDWELAYLDRLERAEQALANFRQSLITLIRSGALDEEALEIVEVAFGFRPTPEQWAAFKAGGGVGEALPAAGPPAARSEPRKGRRPKPAVPTGGPEPPKRNRGKPRKEQAVEEPPKLATGHQGDVAGMCEEQDQQIAGDFIGYHVLIQLFDGDADRWMNWLRTEGSDDQIIQDYPFAAWVKSQQQQDPDFVAKIRRLVENTNLDGSMRDDGSIKQAVAQSEKAAAGIRKRPPRAGKGAK